jgi:hypothetical protein
LNDDYLLIKDVSKRAIAHKLGEYLQPLFPGWNVDCEYNRNGDIPKQILSLETSDLSSIFPDIIVHIRGHNQPFNLLIVVAKKHGERPFNEASDRQKLEAYSDNQGLGYTVGVFVTFRTGCTPGRKYECQFYYKGVWHNE